MDIPKIRPLQNSLGPHHVVLRGVLPFSLDWPNKAIRALTVNTNAEEENYNLSISALLDLKLQSNSIVHPNTSVYRNSNANTLEGAVTDVEIGNGRRHVVVYRHDSNAKRVWIGLRCHPAEGLKGACQPGKASAACRNEFSVLGVWIPELLPSHSGAVWMFYKWR